MLVAAYVVKSLPLEAIRWLVVVVVLYAGLALLRTALARRAAAPAGAWASTPREARPPRLRRLFAALGLA